MLEHASGERSFGIEETVPTSTRRRLGHVPALDGLRGFALCGVLLYHGGKLHGGFQSVDLFFALSGFLITGLVLQEARDGSVSLRNFWVRRVRRLLPGLLFFLLGICVYARYVASIYQLSAIRGDGIATLFYVANWHTIFSGVTYGAGLGGASPMEHTWSLAIEEQFYLLWPLSMALLVAGRRTPGRILGAAIALFVASSALLIGLSFTDVSSNSLYLGTHSRMAAMASGSAVAALRARYGSPRTATGRRTVDALGLVGLGGILLIWSTIHLEDAALYHGVMTIGVVCAGFMIAAAARPGAGGTLLNRFLRLAPLRFLGTISYGFYLWHWPIFLWLDEPRTHLDGWALFAVRVLASGVMAVVSHYLVEQPVLRGALRGRGPVLAPVGVLLVLVALVGSTTGATSAPATGTAGSGNQLPAGDGRTILMLGDSVPSFLVHDGFGGMNADLGYRGAFGGQWGCQVLVSPGGARDGHGILDDSKNRDCTGLMVDALAQVHEPVAILIGFGGVGFDIRIDDTWRDPCEPEYRDAYAAALGRLVRRAGAGGAPVAVMVPPSIPSVLVERTHALHDIPRRMACVADATRQAAEETGAGVVNLRDHLCGTVDTCDLVLPETELRLDGLHFTHERAELVNSWLLPELVKNARAVD